ncbi:NADP-dependent phosphogluconate dehydrogenase [Flavobacterium sp. MAH-1]|uniref:6-phosphogluconate dehydrogenase, decarboxylating n=1 Tax=Flavobacterium agri TaxID=2743471 RepID=A0A7Y8XZ04_9FLAO|nr:NADP-dependent phosphogluconate dehydrogenase [Flavobacterium agri]NUY79526.1 NADP-dependent phosphogluconate dehydrogenase [Flavobacterium agri]NYA69551.1 NADP-dependent phosphogluconate dehydrogenase [Flavobacterium agri]
MNQYDFGTVGLGVMGSNILLNVADHGFSAAGLDLSAEKAASFEAAAKPGQSVFGTTSPEEFAKSLKTPRAIMLLVPAGSLVDLAIENLLPFLEQGDIVIDGGNSYFTDTNRRFATLKEKGIHFFGMGISGGESGARFGPSMMPGGDKLAYERLRPIFEAIAAKVNGDPCVAYMGNGSAGNYVKMVHNGIEYAIMQLISETYDLLKRGLGADDADIQKLFADWNQGELQSFLIEITAEILKVKDEETGDLLVHVISDWARSKGTGKWTSQNAMDLQAPVPSIDSAVTMRNLSAHKQERLLASEILHSASQQEKIDIATIAQSLKDAYYFAMINVYAQGLAQLSIASKEYQYEIDLKEVTKIWRGGCIIRAACLENFRSAFASNPQLSNILLDKDIAKLVLDRQQAARKIAKLAIDKGIPAPVFLSSLSYFDGYRSAVLPTNLIQAQRDFFGAHLYERTDKEGFFHTIWE